MSTSSQLTTNPVAERRAWGNMKERCLNPNNKRWDDYGGRGITICERWLVFENFIQDIGRKPSAKHSLERIDNNGNYEPSNCKWASWEEQRRNMRSNVKITRNGETLIISDWAKRLNIGVNTIIWRLKRGWTHERALTPPRWSRTRSQMKTLLIITTLLIASASINAQTAIHVAADIGVTHNLGFAQPIAGVNVGIQRRKNRFGFSGDFTVDRVRKLTGGSGFQVIGREALQIFKDRFFVQGGAQASHYQVRDFGKTAIAPLGGIGYATNKSMFEATFLADVISPNRERAIETRVTFLLSRHVYLRLSGTVDNFLQGRQRMTGTSTRFQIGAWK